MLPPHSRRWGFAVTLWRFTAQLSTPLIRFTAPTVYMGQQQTHHHPRLTICPQWYECSYSEYELLLQKFRSYSEYFVGENFKLLKILNSVRLSTPWHFSVPLGSRVIIDITVAVAGHQRAYAFLAQSERMRGSSIFLFGVFLVLRGSARLGVLVFRALIEP